MVTFQYDSDAQAAFENVIHEFENAGANGIAGSISVALYADSAFSDWVEEGESIEGFAEQYEAEIRDYSDYTVAAILRQDKTLKDDAGAWADSGLCIGLVFSFENGTKGKDTALCATTAGNFWNLGYGELKLIE